MASTDTNQSGPALLGVGNSLSSALLDLLLCDAIEPGSAPSYQIAKTIYTYHPLGAKMAEKPISIAQSQQREIEIPGGPEEDLVKAFRKEWDRMGGVGATIIIKNLATLSRVYGIASVITVCPDIDSDKPIPLEELWKRDLYFNIVDPLNTAGSLVLNQDPNAIDFLTPRYLMVSGKKYHPSRSMVMSNEQPIYIDYSNSAFGYVGRSVYQRGLYPLKSYVQSMITDQAVTEKAGILVAKMKQPGSIVDQRTRGFFGFKREAIKGAKTGNVISMGIDETLESIDLKNLKDAAEFARNNILKNIASSDNMPASMLNDETLAEGFGEGSEDAKQIATYIAGKRIEMQPAYDWFDNIVMHRAWNPEFYASLQRKYPELAKVKYETAFYEWKNAFTATWPNLLTEPDSEKVKVDDIIAKSAIAVFEVMAPVLDPENLATLAGWLADVMNERDLMFSAPLTLDLDALASYEPPAPPMGGDEPVNEAPNEKDETRAIKRADAVFREQDHPRAEDGKFGSGGGTKKHGGSSPVKTIGDAKQIVSSNTDFKSWFDDGPTDDNGEPIVFVHDSNKEIDEIKGGGGYGGIFALADKSAGYGDVHSYFVTNAPITTSSEISHYVNGLDDAGKSLCEKLLGKDLSDDQVERVIEIATDQFANDDQDDLDLMGAIDLADMFTEMQRVRVALGKAAGGSVIEMEDENGTSYVLTSSEHVRNVKFWERAIKRDSIPHSIRAALCGKR